MNVIGKTANVRECEHAVYPWYYQGYTHLDALLLLLD